MHPERWFDIVYLRLRSLLRRGAVERELDRELRFHLDEEIENNVRRGLTPSAARSAALRRLGGVAQIQEECRDMRRTGTIESFLRDLQYAVRTLIKAPAFALVMVLTLALAVGANSAIFSVIDAVLLRPLPYPRADRIVRIFFASRTFPKFPLNPFDLRDIRARNRCFGAIAGMTRVDRQLSAMGRPERLAGFRITAGYFRVLGVSPALGREFTTEDELPGRSNLVILSDRLWRTRFSAEPGIVGRKIMLDAEPFTVAGVMPPVTHPGNEYHSVPDGDTVDVWTPFTYRGDGSDRGSHYMEGIARLRDGVSIAQAQAGMDALVAQLAREHPDNTRGWHPMVVSLYQELVGPSRRMLLVLLGAVGLVLMIACANAANLLLARATARQREIAVRAALGAGRSRLVRQMLAESLVISLAGGALGAVLAIGGVRALALLAPADFPRAAAIHVNGAVFAFTFAIALATGVLFGLAPAMQAARTDLQQVLREGGRGASAGTRQLWLRNALVVGEVSLACVLLAGAGLLLRSFVNMLRADPGFRPQRVLTAAISLPGAKYKTGKDIVGFYDRLNRALGALPGVRAAGIGSDLPWTGYDENFGGITIEGRQPPPGQDYHARYHVATEDYFQALGVPLVRGRFFTPHDNMNGRPVIIVNRAMARYWGDEDPVGRRITFEDHPKDANDWFTVVGVVGDVKDHPNSAAAEPAFWWSVLQNSFDEMSIVVRAETDPAPLVAEVRDAVRALDPDLAVANLKPMDEIAVQSFSRPRFTLFLVALFAALAAALAGIGIYGVVSYSVSRRTQEFGLRMALGANAWDVVRQVMAQGIRLALGGIVLGVAGALVLGRVLWSLLYQVSPSDPLTFAAVAICAMAITALACYVPARRATTADPVTALRME
jgi:predicted permease